MIVTDEMRILLRINGSAQYTTTMNQVTNVTNNYNKSINSLISSLAKLVSAGMIVKFGKDCLQAASDMQKAEGVISTTFSTTTDTINQWVKKQAADFGLSDKAAKNYIGTFGLMARQFHFTEEQAAKMGIELTKLSGDVASFYNQEDKVAANKLNSIFTGEANGLKDYGIILTEAQLSAYALAKGIAKPFKDMSDQEKVLVRYQYVMEKLAYVQGDFARNSDKLSNSTKSLKLNLENLKVEVGRELIPVVNEGLITVTNILKAASPFLIGIAQTIHYYNMAWKNASETTKAFVKISITAFAVMLLAPRIIAITSAAVKLLTMQIVGLGGALKAILLIAGVLFALLAINDLTKSVVDMKLNKQIDNIGDSAAASSGAVNTLADSMDNLSDSTKGLETFLASFDEVNKVGGNSSLMSNLVTAEDLANILGAATGIGDLQNSLNSLEIPDYSEGTIFDPEWWEEKKELVLGFIDTIGTTDFWSNWKTGLESIDEWLAEHFPKWHATFMQLGADIYDALHPDADKDLRETFSYTNSKTGKVVQGLKYNNDGTLSAAYLNASANAASSNISTVTNNTINSTSPNPIDVTLLLDGRKIASVVTDLQNQKARSSGNSPIIP